MDSRCGSFHCKNGEMSNDRAIYVRPPSADHCSEGMDVSASESADRTLLRNILYCFHFLDTQDRDYINSGEAEEYIRQLKEDNPELFDIMYNVLLVVKQSHGDDHIAKELFIRRCEESLRELSPHDASPINKLRSSMNPIANYFNALKRSIYETPLDDAGCRDRINEGGENEEERSVSISQDVHAIDRGVNPTPSDETVSSSNVEDECTFRPRINKARYPVRSADSSLMLKKEIEEMHRFRCDPGVSNGMDEYIVFHLNKPNEWSRTLRSLKNHNA